MSPRMGSGAGHGRDSTLDLLNSWNSETDLYKSIVDVFEDHNPRTSVNSVHESNVSLQSKVRILTENPPDVWEDWVGPNL